MKSRVFAFAALLLLLAGTASARQAPPADAYRQLTKVTPLPVALDPAFEFRKTKLFVLGDNRRANLGGNLGRGNAKAPAIAAENSYYMYGAVTALDVRRRSGNYFDFFWRVKRPADVTVRLEYQQENLRAFTQAREVSYENVKGSRKTSFRIVGDDYFGDGRVLAWRCLLIERGRIVAEDRSFLWR